MSKTYSTHHMGLCVRGALANWSDRELRAMFTKEDGTKPTAYEAKNYLMDELSKGHETIPLGPGCDNWDWKTGCKGHPTTEDAIAKFEKETV